MSDRLVFPLCGLAVFLIPLGLQLALCFLAPCPWLRWAGLLIPALWFLAAAAALLVDESHSFISLRALVAKVLAVGGLLALAGCGLAWGIYTNRCRERNALVTDKLKTILTSDTGMKVINLLFLLSMLIRKRGIILIAYLVWIAYLVYCIKNISSQFVRIVYGIFIVFAAVMIALNVYFMIKLV
jgi:hypothetical protein